MKKIILLFLVSLSFSCKKNNEGNIYGKWQSLNDEYNYTLDIRENGESGEYGTFVRSGSSLTWTTKSGDTHLFKIKEVKDDAMTLEEQIFIYPDPAIIIQFKRTQ